MASKKGMERPRSPGAGGFESETFDVNSRVAVVAGDQAVAQHHHAARVRGDVGLVRHHDHRLALLGERLRTRA